MGFKVMTTILGAWSPHDSEVVPRGRAGSTRSIADRRPGVVPAFFFVTTAGLVRPMNNDVAIAGANRPRHPGRGGRPTRTRHPTRRYRQEQKPTNASPHMGQLADANSQPRCQCGSFTE